MRSLSDMPFTEQNKSLFCAVRMIKTFAALNDGEFIGYVVTNNDKNCWAEICVENGKDLEMTPKRSRKHQCLRDLLIEPFQCKAAFNIAKIQPVLKEKKRLAKEEDMK